VVVVVVVVVVAVAAEITSTALKHRPCFSLVLVPQLSECLWEV